jgi:histidinol-phosphate aminotransferase
MLTLLENVLARSEKMAFINARLGLDRLEEYEVETVDADIIVNANENNYPMPAPVLEEILERTTELFF